MLSIVTIISLLMFRWTTDAEPIIIGNYLFRSAMRGQCVHTGAFNTYVHSSWSKAPNRRAMGIGADKFASIFGSVMRSGVVDGSVPIFIGPDGVEKQDCLYSWNPGAARDLELCDEQDKRFKIKIYAVQQTDSNGTTHLLNGWLHIEIELVDKSDSIRFVYAQVDDDLFNAIGEFVTDPLEQCPPSDPSVFLGPTPYQVLPCSAVGPREVKPSQAVYMVAKQDLLDPKTGEPSEPLLMPIENLRHGVHFTWRLNEYWCNRHFKFRPEVYILTTKSIELWRINTKNGTATGQDLYKDHFLYRKMPNYWLRSEWVGAADIKHPNRGDLKCDKLVTNDEPGHLTGVATWINLTPKSTVKQEYIHPDFQVGSVRFACQTHPYEAPRITYTAFGGRCTENHTVTRKRTSHDYLQACNTNSSSTEFEGLNFTKYTQYTKTLNISRSLQCSNPCRGPVTVEDAINISNIFVKTVTKEDLLNPGLVHTTRSKHNILRFWRGRKYHGILCIFCAMFLNPVSLFAARYLKETFMQHQCCSIQVWFWVHICCSIASITLFVTSQITLHSSNVSWGHSLHLGGKIHHSIGWLAHFVLIIMIIFGAFRKGPKKLRKITLRLHLLVGFVHYFACLFLVVSSAEIPASPLLHRCDLDLGFPIGIPFIHYVVGGWILVDTCFHILMTRIEHFVERRIKVIHPGYFPTIPVLFPESRRDMGWSDCRKNMFYAYIGISFLFTWTAMFHLSIRQQPRGCSFGEMTCKAALGCSRVGLALCKKLKYNNCEG